MIRINLRDIRSEGLTFDKKIEAGTIQFEEDETIRIVWPVTLRARISRVDKTVFAGVCLTGAYASYCARCLEDAGTFWTKTFLFDFPVEKDTPYIDLAEDIRQELVLNLPSRLYCGENCRGICCGCGVNLNHEACVCIHEKNNESGSGLAVSRKEI